MDLEGRVALLTGGAGHIGLVAAEALLELGATVAIVDKNPESCRERAAILGPKALPFACDLLSEQSTREVIHQVVGPAGRLDILVHCAAYGGATQMPGWVVPFEQQTVAAWDSALRVNLTAAFVLAQEAREALAASGHGSIILVASIYGLCGPDMRLYDGTSMANPLGYGASKAGLLQLVRALATTLGPAIRVNAISPGGVLRGQPAAFRERYESRTPLRRMAAEEDMKGAVAYLASDMSAYVTGHNLVVDGGWTAW